MRKGRPTRNWSPRAKQLKNRRTELKRKAWAKALKRGKCHWCRIAEANTLDHVIPVSEGGSNKPDNVVGACWKCNHERGTELSDRKQGRNGDENQT